MESLGYDIWMSVSPHSTSDGTKISANITFQFIVQSRQISWSFIIGSCSSPVLRVWGQSSEFLCWWWIHRTWWWSKMWLRLRSHWHEHEYEFRVRVLDMARTSFTRTSKHSWSIVQDSSTCVYRQSPEKSNWENALQKSNDMPLHRYRRTDGRAIAYTRYSI